MMRARRVGFIATVVVSVVLGATASFVLGDDKAGPDFVQALLSIGKIGPDAVKLKVWTNLSKGKPAKVGDHVVIHFKADRDCYLVVANVSDKGDVAIVLPNRERPDNSVKANKEYTLFGDDSKLKLVFGKPGLESKLVFYVSPRPIDLKPLKMGQDNGVILIPAKAGNELKIFREKIEEMATHKEFNRKLLSLKADPKRPIGLKLMGVPAGAASEAPAGVTGTRGRVDKLKELMK